MHYATAPELGPAVPQLPSGNVEESARFFEEKLGFTVVALYVEHGHAVVRRGQAEIQFWQAPTEEQARQLGSQCSCYIRARGIDSLYAEFASRGVETRYGPQAQPWGMHEMQIDDPFGNAIRFGEPAA